MNLAHLLRRAAQTYPERVAVMHGSSALYTYAALTERTQALAAYLQHSLRLAAGERVALCMGNHVAYLEILFAAWWAGLVVVPINAKLHAKELDYILRDAQASVLFASAQVRDAMPAASVESLHTVLVPDEAAYAQALHLGRAARPTAYEPAQCQGDDVAWLFYTSGTTGQPKGVMQTHRNLYAMTACYFMDVDSVDAQDAWVYAAPMSHGAGLYGLPFVAQAARHVVPLSGGFEPQELLALSRSVGRLCLFAAPTMVKRLVAFMDEEKRQGKSDTSDVTHGFKTIVYGGGPMYVEDIVHAMDVMGPCFVQIYGQGESPMTITALSRSVLQARTHAQWTQRIASVGVAQTLVQVRVVNEQGQPLGAGEVGEIVVRGDTVMAGYWRNPQASAQTLQDGWLWTGDMGCLDADGFLTLKDRSKDVVISGGSNIYPREVEEVLLQYPGVQEVCVVGQSDAEWGEVLVAFIVGTNLDATALDHFCLSNIARFKRPKHYRFVEALPKNNYGKVLKTVVRGWV